MIRTVMAFIIAALSLAATAASAAEPAWQAAETAHFIIYSKGSQQRLEKLATDLESFDQLMRMATGIRPDLKPVKVRIYEVDGLQEIQAALGLDSNSGIAGFYESNSLGPYLVTPRKTGFEGEDFGPGLVLHHEYAHHFMLQYFPASYPGWYTEGFAELIGSSKTLPDGSIGYGMPAKHRGHEIAAYWVPLQEVLTKEDIRDLDTYAQGWAMTHFFTFDRTRAAQLREYLAALKAGKSLAESAKVFGDLGALNQQARAYVLGGTFSYKPVKVEIVSPAVQRFRTVSPGEAALIPEVIAFRDADLNEIKKPGWRERERKLRETNLRRTREQVQRFPNDPFALSFLAEAEFLSGNYAQSEAAADRLLAIDPNNVRGLARKAIAMAVQARSLPGPAKAARIAEARRLAVRANKLDTEDPMPLLAYYQSFHAAGQSAPPIAVEGLMQAVSTMPRDTNSRLLLVDELASQHRWVEAIAWLVPFANALDDSPLRDSIREKLAWLRAQYAKEKGAAAAKS